MRLIDADALTKRLIAFCNKNCPYTAKERNVMCDSCFMGLALEAVEDAPTIEERKTGKWQVTDAYPHNVYCSECHKKFAQTHWAVWEDGSLPRNFCPNCGSYNGG